MQQNGIPSATLTIGTLRLTAEPLTSSELAGVGPNRRNSASCDETGRITFSFFVHLSFAFCRHSSHLVLRNIEGRHFGVDFDGCSLRSDCRQGSMPASRRFARTSLRVLDCVLAPASALLWESERSPLLFVGFRFHQFSQVLEVMPPQKNRSASPVSRSFLAITQERPFEVTFERFLISLRKERPR